MRLFWICALFAASAFGEGITIVLDFDGPRSEQTVAEMKREFEGIVKESALTIDWRTREQAQKEAVNNLVVVRFKGKCVLEPVPYLYDERGPMAFTYSTGGVVQPFSEVTCEKVATAVRSALPRSDYAKADELFGRALGRVMAHELVHMLTGRSGHSRDGVARASLSGNQLIAPELKLSREDLQRLADAPHKLN